MSINIGKVSVPVNQNDGQISIDTKRIRADILSGQFDEISVTSNERRVNPEVVQIPITLTSQEEIIGLVALKGAQGTSIASITKTGTSGLVDTYTILMTDGTTATFEVTNGEKGDPGSSIVSITKTGTSGLVDTYTILMSDGTTSTFTVTNGSGGSWGSITGTLSDQTDLQDALDTKVNIADLGDLASKDTVDWDTDIDDIPATFPPSVHNHDDRYYTETEVDAKLQPMYGYCETASNVVAKTVSISNFTLVTGRTVFIKFEYENTADDPTLNISNTGAINIVRYGTDPASEDRITWSDGEVNCFTYDGTSWIESGGAGGLEREDTISFHGSDMIVEPGTNRITFDDSDMIIHPPDGAAWLERTMEALEGGIAIISTNNEHSAIANGQYVYIRMHTSLPDGLYKATTDIAQNAELSTSNVVSASGALNDKSDVGHTHDDRYYTESEVNTKLQTNSNNDNYVHNTIGSGTSVEFNSMIEKTGTYQYLTVYRDGTVRKVNYITGYHLKKDLGTALPLIKYKAVTVGNIKIGSGGYVSIASFKPSPPSADYTLFGAFYKNWSSNGGNAIQISLDGEWVQGTPNQQVNNLQVQYYFILNSDVSAM